MSRNLGSTRPFQLPIVVAKTDPPHKVTYVHGCLYVSQIRPIGKEPGGCSNPMPPIAINTRNTNYPSVPSLPVVSSSKTRLSLFLLSSAKWVTV